MSNHTRNREAKAIETIPCPSCGAARGVRCSRALRTGCCTARRNAGQTMPRYQSSGKIGQLRLEAENIERLTRLLARDAAAAASYAREPEQLARVKQFAAGRQC